VTIDRLPMARNSQPARAQKRPGVVGLGRWPDATAAGELAWWIFWPQPTTQGQRPTTAPVQV